MGWNIFTAAYVDAAMKYAVPDMEEASIMNHQEQQRDYRELLSLWQGTFVVDTKRVKMGHVYAFLANSKVKDFLNKRGITLTDVELLYDTLVCTLGDKTLDMEVLRANGVPLDTMITWTLKVKKMPTNVELLVIDQQIAAVFEEQRLFF